MSQSSRLGELSWIAEARTHIGLREVPGPKNNSVILGWLRKLRAGLTCRCWIATAGCRTTRLRSQRAFDEITTRRR